MELPKQEYGKSISPVLELKDISLNIGSDEEPRFLLQNITATYTPGHFGAIIGPSGCGKSTLLKVISGLTEATAGEIFCNGRNLNEEDFSPTELGFVPQFSIAHESLTVRESINTALQLRASGLSREERRKRTEQLLGQIGMTGFADRTNKVLSGGQRRRLSLALEMVTRPSFFLCDEVTSGLDPKSEDEIVHLLHDLSRADGRIVLSVTHSLHHLALYDSVTVLYHGKLAYQGKSDLLLHYFQVAHPDDLFPALAKRTAQEWEDAWQQSKIHYALSAAQNEPTASHPPMAKVADPLTQFFVLLSRRWKLFFRDAGQMWLQLALLLIFPVVVTLFALKGLPQVLKPDMKVPTDFGEYTRQITEGLHITTQNSQTGALVSGLIMFQVILLTLMGSNNSAREIVAERHIFEKEKLGGLSPFSYISSKLAYLVVLVTAQSVWMTFFVAFVCSLLGNLPLQLMNLWLVNLSMTLICLGISSWSKTTEQASLISIYLVGFQLPLSGAVLALPDWIGAVTRPFISAYWSWSGYVQSLISTEYYDLVKSMTQTPVANGSFCLIVLVVHALAGVCAAYFGCIRSQQDS